MSTQSMHAQARQLPSEMVISESKADITFLPKSEFPGQFLICYGAFLLSVSMVC